VVELPRDNDRPLGVAGLCGNTNRGLVAFKAASDAEYGGFLTVSKITCSNFGIGE